MWPWFRSRKCAIWLLSQSKCLYCKEKKGTRRRKSGGHLAVVRCALLCISGTMPVALVCYAKSILYSRIGQKQETIVRVKSEWSLMWQTRLCEDHDTISFDSDSVRYSEQSEIHTQGKRIHAHKTTHYGLMKSKFMILWFYNAFIFPQAMLTATEDYNDLQHENIYLVINIYLFILLWKRELK